MTTRFRLDGIELETDQGRVQYSFPSPLTVLAGGVGVGKSTLFELVKYALGGKALLALVVQDHVLDVTVSVTIGKSRFRLVRSVDPSSRSVVRVTDLISGERLRDHHINNEVPTLSDLLLEALGLPPNMRAAPRSAGATSRGGRITFNDIFTFLYVPQAEISRDIADSLESYREPKRRAVFELLFGLTDPIVLEKRSDRAALKGELQTASAQSETVQRFLVASGTANKIEADLSQERAREQEVLAAASLESLRDAIEPVVDRETQTLRDLLTETERTLAEARDSEVRLSQQLVDLTGERREVSQDLDRLRRLNDAGERLANIEFKVCPRCLQDVTQRDIEPHLCRLCLQEDPLALAEPGRGGEYERTQLLEQLDELGHQLALGEQDLAASRVMIGHREDLVGRLSAQIDARTVDRIAPRLQAYEDTSQQLADARSRQRELDVVLRQWDIAEDWESAAESVQRNIARLTDEINSIELGLAERKRIIIHELSEEFADSVGSIGIPGVESATIDPLTYLPVLNGKGFQQFSPAGGGIRTATQVAYWMTLLTVALRRRDTMYPAFLLLDSPRTSLNNSDRLARALYSRVIRQADIDGTRLQIVVGDNELPAEYRRQFAQLDFDYEHPTVSTIQHPGPSAVVRVNESVDGS